MTDTSDHWNHGNLYERYVGRWSRRVAAQFVPWLDRPKGQRWLDVGCGTGALLQTVLDLAAPASVVGVEPSEGFLALARQRVGERATLCAGDAARTGLPDDAVDVSVSGLVLNFVPDIDAALAEMRRVTRSGGLVAAYVWDYGGRMELMRRFWDGAIALGLEGAAAKAEATRFPMCEPDALATTFRRAGLRAVRVEPIEVPTRFVDFDDYWQPFLGGQGPAPAYVTALDEAARTRLREHLRASLPTGADGAIALVARAWAARGER